MRSNESSCERRLCAAAILAVAGPVLATLAMAVDASPYVETVAVGWALVAGIVAILMGIRFAATRAKRPKWTYASLSAGVMATTWFFLGCVAAWNSGSGPIYRQFELFMKIIGEG